MNEYRAVIELPRFDDYNLKPYSGKPIDSLSMKLEAFSEDETSEEALNHVRDWLENARVSVYKIGTVKVAGQ